MSNRWVAGEEDFNTFVLANAAWWQTEGCKQMRCRHEVLRHELANAPSSFLRDPDYKVSHIGLKAQDIYQKLETCLKIIWFADDDIPVASLASMVQARNLLRIADALRVPRVVLVGDAKQLDDNHHALLPACREEVEAEANHGAGRLLFLCDRFTKEVQSLEPSIETIRTLRDIFGNTLSTTLYRFVESAGGELPDVGMITGHPHMAR